MSAGRWGYRPSGKGFVLTMEGRVYASADMHAVSLLADRMNELDRIHAERERQQATSARAEQLPIFGNH
jgi:hypothetical protein